EVLHGGAVERQRLVLLAGPRGVAQLPFVLGPLHRRVVDDDRQHARLGRPPGLRAVRPAGGGGGGKTRRRVGHRRRAQTRAVTGVGPVVGRRGARLAHHGQVVLVGPGHRVGADQPAFNPHRLAVVPGAPGQRHPDAVLEEVGAVAVAALRYRAAVGDVGDLVAVVGRRRAP